MMMLTIMTISSCGLLHFLLLLLTYFKVASGLRNVNLTIVPSIVNISKSAVLYCDYDLEGSPLYSVKWYRGESEFYRYTETDEDKVQVFDIAGFDVNLARSNSTQVYLRNISDFKHSGNFTCEVTDDGQPISSATDMQSMVVVQLPPGPPTIGVGHKPLDYDDILRANCSSLPSKPQATLRMSLNNIVIGRTNMTLMQRSQEPMWSDLYVERELSEFYFREGGGKLILECVAQVSGYEIKATLSLVSARNPVSQRVSAYGSRSDILVHTPTMQLITLGLALFFHS